METIPPLSYSPTSIHSFSWKSRIYTKISSTRWRDMDPPATMTHFSTLGGVSCQTAYPRNTCGRGHSQRGVLAPTALARWLVGGSRDAILTIVNCEEAYGVHRQNTIGWIREANSGIVFLVYFIDTLELDSEEVQKEVLDTLASIRVPRLHPGAYAWNIQSLILHKSVPRQGMITSSLSPQRV
jgi:hypothetical protein